MGPPVGSPNQGPGALGRGRPGAWDREKENDGEFQPLCCLRHASLVLVGRCVCLFDGGPKLYFLHRVMTIQDCGLIAGRGGSSRRTGGTSGGMTRRGAG